MSVDSWIGPDGPVADCGCLARETCRERGRDVLFGENIVDRLADRLLGWTKDTHVPVGIGAWHWFHIDTRGQDTGYGSKNGRGTYFYYITADPQFDLGEGRKIGGHLEYEFRDDQPYRTFYNRLAWSYEAYLYYQTEELGTLKAGQVLTRFGLDWPGGFWPVTINRDGFTRDPDYGLSWEKTTEVNQRLKCDSFVQFFFHEDGINGSFAGGDSESFVGVHERNTGIVRVVPTWTFPEGDSQLAIGLSGLVGQIDSRRPDFADNVQSAWELDVTYTRDPWKLYAQASQIFGRRAPVRFVSGGPSNRLTDFLVGAEYNPSGPLLYRATYSTTFDANPSGREQILLAGTQVKVTEHCDFFVEYVNERVDGNATLGSFDIFNSFALILWWHY